MKQYHRFNVFSAFKTIPYKIINASNVVSSLFISMVCVFYNAVFLLTVMGRYVCQVAFALVIFSTLDLIVVNVLLVML